MKKFLIGCSLLCFIAVQASAQIPSFNQGDNVAGATIGFGGYYSGSYWNNVTRIPLISLYYENCVKDNLWDEKSSLGIGGMLGYTSVKYENWKTSTTVLGFRGALHYAFVDKLDTYTGLMLGYNIISWNDDIYKYGNGSHVYIAWFLGARYYFTDTFAALAELGVGAASINLGVAFKF